MFQIVDLITLLMEFVKRIRYNIVNWIVFSSIKHIITCSLFVLSCVHLSAQAVVYSSFQAGVLHKDKGEYSEAIKDFTSFIEKYPTKTAEVYLERGYSYLYLKKYEQAITDFIQVMEMEPKKNMGSYALGKTYYQQGDFGKSLEYFDKSLGIQPLDARSLNDRGMSKCRLGDFDSAVKDFIKATTIDTSFAMAYNNAGAARYYNQDIENPIKKDIREAIGYFSKAIDYDPTLTMAYRNRGAMYLFLGELDASLKDLTIAGRLEPRKAVIPFYKAVVLGEKKSYPVALENLKKAIALEPSFFYAYEEQGDIFMKMKKYDDAINAYRTALSKSDNSTYKGLMYFKTALVYAARKNKAQMYLHLKSARKSGAFKDRAVYRKFTKNKSLHRYRREKKFRKFTKSVSKIKKEDGFSRSELRWFRMYD